MDKEQKKLLTEIMAEDFVAIDFLLYLDTHPHDMKALADFREAVRRSNLLKEKYEKQYCPLTAFQPNGSKSFCWVEEPWPWQVNFAD